MDTAQAISRASQHLVGLGGHVFDLLDVRKPQSVKSALNLSRVVSKLSPILGNLIEFEVVEQLNSIADFSTIGKWERQDPGFPDTIFRGTIVPAPGFEIKAWFPLATEITARFKDSQNHFVQNQTYVAMLAWLPEHLIYGRPRIIDACVVSGMSVAKARDEHYHHPPDYLVVEPEDTSLRRANLQQTNTNGYKWQGTTEEFVAAEGVVSAWGPGAKSYRPTRTYQSQVNELRQRYNYRLDTNYAKMDRVGHPKIEAFKERVMATVTNGLTIARWAALLANSSDSGLRREFGDRLGIINP